MHPILQFLKWIHKFIKRDGENITLSPWRFQIISKFLRTGLTDTFISELGKGDVVVDIGANIGYYSILAAQLTGSNGKVFAFEPDKRHFEKLSNHIRLNACENVVIENKGISDKAEKLRLYLSPDNSSDHATYPVEGRENYEVEVVALDQYCTDRDIDRVNLVKIDVQGYEPVAFEGMKETLRKNQDIKVISEFWPDGIRRAHQDPDAYLQAFEEFGFNSYLVTERKKIRRISRAEILKLVQNGSDDLDILFKRT